MVRLALVAGVLWLFLFTLRVMQVGGMEADAKDRDLSVFTSLRQNLAHRVDNLLPFPQSALLNGILLGEKQNLPFFLRKDLQATSTIHMVVVSGQNLSILGGFIMSLTSLLGRRKTIAVTLFVILFYSLISGFQAPVVRAAIMSSLAYLGQILGRQYTSWWILFITAGIMLLFNPNYLVSISFQLSFLATFGVIVVAPLLAQLFKKVPNILRQDLAVTLAAQAMVLPPIAYYFHQVSLSGILANSLVIWTIPLVMVTGMLALALGSINMVSGQIIGLIPGTLLTYFLDVVQIFARLPFSVVQIGETAPILWVGYYLLVLAAIWSLSNKKKTA